VNPTSGSIPGTLNALLSPAGWLLDCTRESLRSFRPARRCKP
jgi:hypothetical protein